MNSLLEAVDSHTTLLVAAIVVAVLLLNLLFGVLKVSLKPLLTIVAIALVLQYVFNISPRQLWYEITQLPYEIMRLVNQLVEANTTLF